MELRLYDTLTKEKRPFVPLDPKNVRMYVCGPTVYDFAHIGNARPVIVFDVLFRAAAPSLWRRPRHLCPQHHRRRRQDQRARRARFSWPAAERGDPQGHRTRRKSSFTRMSMRWAACGRRSSRARPNTSPEMRAIIEKLVAGGFAYVAEDHVLFSPQAMNAANSVMPRYGALSKRSLDEMIAGARVDVAPYKRDNTDFVLWKPSKPGEPSWPSPAGIKAPGRPGWHIECSAMAWKHLGEKFDIHGGGIDLVFPHHENELAQTCCAFHSDRMANVWMHNGFLQVESEKMSKSLGNFFTIRDLLADWPGEVLRLNMLKTHYRSPLDWTVEGRRRKREDARRLVCGREPTPRSASRRRRWSRRCMTTSIRRRRMAVLHGLRNAAASGGERERRASSRPRSGCSASSRSAAAWKGRKQQAQRRRSRKRGRSPDCGARGRACAKGLQGIRSHPRRTRRDGRCHQGRQGCRRKARDHMGDRVMTKPDTPFPKHWRYYIFIKMGADRCRGRAGLETVRSVLTRWDRHCPNPACGRICRRMFRCWRRSSLPRSRN